VSSNAQAVAGSTLTAAYPQNLIWNANGQEPGAGVTSTTWALGSKGHDETLYTNQDWAAAIWSCTFQATPASTAMPMSISERPLK
jgi:hypothetical protein